MSDIWLWSVWDQGLADDSSGPADTPSSFPDLTDYEVEATDGHIGKVDATNNGTNYHSLVVDTGFWISGKKRVIPGGVVQYIDAADRRVYLSCTKEQVRGAPDYDEAREQEPSYRANVGDHFAASP